ncbi:MAG: oligoendopeptidase F [Bacillota bacterium]
MKTRKEISAQFKWRLEDIYATSAAWEADFTRVGELCTKFAGMKGQLLESTADGSTLKAVLKLQEELFLLAEQLYVFARMSRDEDNSNADTQSLAGRAQALLSNVGAATSYLSPELLSLDEEKVLGWVAEEVPEYKFYFEELFRQKAHVLSDKEEELLALASEVDAGAKNIFTMFNNADLKFGEIKDAEGNSVELTKGNYTNFLESPDVSVRKGAFEAMYRAYGAYKNTLAASFSANVKGDIFFANARKYGSCREKALDSDFVPTAVYDKLIEAVDANLPSLDKYLRLRKRALGLKELHMYDLYTPLLPEVSEKLTYEQAYANVLDGLSTLGDEYSGLLKTGYESGWIDVYETRGKTGGAYSWGCYSSHPYVLLNFQGKLNDMFTIAHEMGHAMHTYFSNRAQPYIYSEYKIFVAEVASTVNEILLMKSLLAKTTDAKVEAYLLNHYLEEFRGTVFRQTMFAEFEKLAHANAEAGEALTAEGLSALYYGLNEKFFGREVLVDKEIELEWSRIPHFYNAFYVYKYATGFSAAVAIVKMILEEGAPAVARYMEFLSSGGSDYPLELLKKVGVDLTSTKPVDDALAEFGATVARLEALL